MFKRVREDIQAVWERDPAPKTSLEIVLCYPGLHAVWAHRWVTHPLYRMKAYGIARFISQLVRFLTNVEIHPGAILGRRLFIDHGAGVVIGETAELGDDVTIFQGVTLGGSGKEHAKRHPTLGNNVVVSAGAKVLGSFRIGENSTIGAGSIVLKEIPPNSTVVGVPGRVIAKDGIKVNADMRHDRLPDPVIDMIHDLSERIYRLEKELGEERMGA